MSIQKDNPSKIPLPKVDAVNDAHEVELPDGELEQVAGGVRVEFNSEKKH